MDLPIIDVVKVSLVYLPGDTMKAILTSIIVYRLRKHPFFARQSKNLAA